MSWFGTRKAKAFGGKLPTFAHQAEAEAALYAERDERLKCLANLAKSSRTFAPFYSPDSLKNLEKWYFELWEAKGFENLGISREDFECCMAAYFCEVAVRNCAEAKWEVREYSFERGRYEIGVQRGLSHLMLTRFTDHYKQPKNRNQQKIFEMYKERFA